METGRWGWPPDCVSSEMLLLTPSFPYRRIKTQSCVQQTRVRLPYTTGHQEEQEGLLQVVASSSISLRMAPMARLCYIILPLDTAD